MLIQKKFLFGFMMLLLIPALSTDAINLTHKNSYQLVSQKEAANRNLYEVFKDGDMLYAVLAYSASDRVIEVINASNPQSLSYVATIESDIVKQGDYSPRNYVSNGHLYVLTDNELVTLDISDPQSPLETSRLTTSASLGTIEQYNDHLYIKSYIDETLTIVDISTPGTPVIASVTSDDDSSMLEAQGRVIAKSGDHIFISSSGQTQFATDAPSGIDVFNVVDISNPLYVRSYNGPEWYFPHIQELASEVKYAVDNERYLNKVTFASDGTVSTVRGERNLGGERYQEPGFYFLSEDFYAIDNDIIALQAVGTNIDGINGLRLLGVDDINDVEKKIFVSDLDLPQMFSPSKLLLNQDYAYVSTRFGEDEGNQSSIEIFSLRDQLYRFWSDKYRGHFFTTSLAERDLIIANDANWAYEGIAYETVGETEVGAAPVHRFWSSVYKHHFYTVSQQEKDSIIASNPNWAYEGEAYNAFKSQQEGTIPVYRFWSDKFKGHFYTSNREEKESIEANDANWAYEGVAWWVKQ